MARPRTGDRRRRPVRRTQRPREGSREGGRVRSSAGRCSREPPDPRCRERPSAAGDRPPSRSGMAFDGRGGGGGGPGPPANFGQLVREAPPGSAPAAGARFVFVPLDLVRVLLGDRAPRRRARRPRSPSGWRLSIRVNTSAARSPKSCETTAAALGLPARSFARAPDGSPRCARSIGAAVNSSADSRRRCSASTAGLGSPPPPGSARRVSWTVACFDLAHRTPRKPRPRAPASGCWRPLVPAIVPTWPAHRPSAGGERTIATPGRQSRRRRLQPTPPPPGARKPASRAFRRLHLPAQPPEPRAPAFSPTPSSSART